jgi:hypothetical protein
VRPSRIARIRALRGYGHTHKYLVEDPEMTIAATAGRRTSRRATTTLARLRARRSTARVWLEGYSTIELPRGLDADAGRVRDDPRCDS